MSPPSYLVLRETHLRQGNARRDAHLRLHDVDARHLLSHGVLHLQCGVKIMMREGRREATVNKEGKG